MFRLFSFNPASGSALKGIVDDFASLLFTHKYTGIGTWQLSIDSNKENASIWEIGDIYEVTSRRWGLVTYINKSLGISSNTTIVKGVELKGLAMRRITVPPSGSDNLVYTTDAAEDVIKGMIDTQIISATDTDRRIGYVVNAATLSRGASISYQSRYKGLSDELTTIATNNDLGWYAYLNPSTGQIVFDVWEGLDRTASQSTNNRILLGLSYDNLTGRNIITDVQDFANTAYTAGAGEGAAREIEIVGEYININRYEVFIDARDIDAGASAELIARGEEKLAEYGDIDTFTAEFNNNANYEFFTDFDVGDIVTIVDPDLLGGKQDIRVTESTEIYEQNAADTIELTFGYNSNTLVNPIKRKFNQLSMTATT